MARLEACQSVLPQEIMIIASVCLFFVCLIEPHFLVESPGKVLQPPNSTLGFGHGKARRCVLSTSHLNMAKLWRSLRSGPGSTDSQTQLAPACFLEEKEGKPV